ncbi:MAG TPA: hypothetical protein DCK96_09960 [Chloroflexi bacterium]|nr:hypothetical protein [Chloroflexota bacterium]
MLENIKDRGTSLRVHQSLTRGRWGTSVKCMKQVSNLVESFLVVVRRARAARPQVQRTSVHGNNICEFGPREPRRAVQI